MARKRSRKQTIRMLTQYGIHIWAILIIANAALVYAYNFATHAQTRSKIPVHTEAISQTPSPSLSPSLSRAASTSPSPQPSPSTGPLGPVISLTFSVPGIGSGGGILKPLHPKRNVTVYLYSTDVNSLNPSVKPLYTIQSSAVFDSNPYSPTYTSFVNPGIDLGSDVKDGNYQIAFRTDLSLRTLIKQNSTDLGGESISLSKSSQTLQIPPQQVLMGDVLPVQGDNNIDASDYNAFINCYGAKYKTSSFCKGHNYGDFNDDGVIDGIDYNILLRSLNTLQQEGFTIPTLSPTPYAPYHVTKLKNPASPTPVKKNKKTASPAAKTTNTNQSGGSPVGGILFLLFLIILIAIGVVLYFKNDMVRSKINTLIHLSPTGSPPAGETETTESDQPAEAEPEKNAAVPPTTKTPAKAAPPKHTAGETVEKDCYVKKKGPDAKGTGVILTLTDDNGMIEAHYAKKEVADGFAKVKGVMKTENGKTFLEVSELSAEG